MTTLSEASHQWYTRAADERFLSLPSLRDFKQSVANDARAQVVSTRKLQAVPVDGDSRALALLVDDQPTLPTNWAFSQLAQRAGAPASYLPKLRPDLAADCINYGLARESITDVGIYTHDHLKLGHAQLAAATGPNYGRVRDLDIVQQLIDRFGDGVTGDWTVPGEFGVALDEVTKDNTTLYASDRNMFVFLADEKNRIEVPNRRNGESGTLARGFFVKNSEVGDTTLSITGFLFDYACKNRTVWGAEEIKEVSIRHSKSAPEKFLEEVAPALDAYSKSSCLSITQAIENAKSKRIDDIDDFLKGQTFSRSAASAIKLVHVAEEGRPIETLYDASTAITAYARGVKYQDQRVDFERIGGKVLKLAQ